MNDRSRPTAWVPRESRVPLYVPVLTEPPLPDCFAVNLSPSGVGLVTSRRPGESLPAEGSLLSLELTLPGAGAAITLAAVVQWREDTSAVIDDQVAVAMGLRLMPSPAAAVAELQRFLAAYRPHVVAVGADPAERELLQQSLAPHVHLHHATTADELFELLGRGDVSAVILLGREAGPALALVARLANPRPETTAATPALAQDLSPRVIYAAEPVPTLLVELFNRNQLFASLTPPLSAAALETTVLRACGDFGVRTEQHRATLALERALWRARAQARPGARLDAVTRDLLVVESAAMRAVVEAARAVAPHKIGVLLTGETGTGKEVIARLIHALSDRAGAAFLVQDCGALTETLLDSELFGHVKGAFTGAVQSHPGLFLFADGGTVLLDEIENMSPALQAKVLRVIDTGEVRAVGGTRVQRVDVRVIAATNRDPTAEVAAGRLRADLFYRLGTFPIALPPLRARRDDVLPLADHFRARAEESLGKPTAGFSPAAKRHLLGHDWPGNVRELRNVVERSVLLARPGAGVEVELAPTAWSAAAPLREDGSLDARVAAAERELIRAALARNGGIVRRAARELGVNAVTLGRKVKQHGLDAPRSRPSRPKRRARLRPRR